MKLRITSQALFLACFLAAPVFATTIYSNGPINGTTDAWTINFGFVVSDSFTIGGNGAHVNGVSFGAWLFPGDVLQSAEISITDSEFGGTTFFDGIVNFSQNGCVGNQYGFNVCTETGGFNTLNLADGTYWLNLQNAVVIQVIRCIGTRTLDLPPLRRTQWAPYLPKHSPSSVTTRPRPPAVLFPSQLPSCSSDREFWA